MPQTRSIANDWLAFGVWGKAPAPKSIFVVFVLFVATNLCALCASYENICQ